MNQSKISRISVADIKKMEDVESNSSKFCNVNLIRLCMLENDWITHVMKTSMW